MKIVANAKKKYQRPATSKVTTVTTNTTTPRSRTKTIMDVTYPETIIY